MGTKEGQILGCPAIALVITLTFENSTTGNSLVVQWLRLCAPNAGILGSIPCQETRSHMLQLRPGAAK